MLTHNALKTFGQAINSSSAFGFTPFKYNHDKNKLSCLTKRIPVGIFLTQISSQFCYLVFLAWNLALTLGLIPNARNKSTYADVLWLCLFNGGTCWAVLSSLCVWLRRKDIVDFFNSIVKFSRSSHIMSNSTKDLKHDVLFLVIMYLRLSCVMTTATVAAMFLANPKSRLFISSAIMAESHEPSPLELIPWVVYVYYYVYGITSILIFDVIGIVTIYIIFSSWMLHQLRICGKASIVKVRLYMGLTIINRKYIDAAGYALTLMFVIFGSQWILGTIGTIRLYAAVEAFDYLVLCITAISGVAILLGLLHFCGNVPKRGEILIKDLLNLDAHDMTNMQKKIFIRTVKSLMVFGVKSGPTRLLRHKAMYLYFGGLINFVVTFLVAYPNFGE